MTNEEIAIKLGLEGGLYVDINLMSIFGNSYSASKHHYAVVKGIVYAVGNGKFIPSKDELYSLTATCKRIGKYKEGKHYKDVIRNDISYAEIKKLLKL